MIRRREFVTLVDGSAGLPHIALRGNACRRLRTRAISKGDGARGARGEGATVFAAPLASSATLTTEPNRNTLSLAEL
jgi:hypothetical protein